MAGDIYCNNDMNPLAKTIQTAVAINITEGEYKNLYDRKISPEDHRLASRGLPSDDKR